MSNEDFIRLAAKIADGTADSKEIALYNACYETFQLDTQSWSEMRLQPEKLQKESLQNFWKQIGRPQKTIRIWPRIVAAASVIICLSIGGYIFSNKPQAQKIARITKQDISPGGNKAILTLSNGKRIILTAAKNGFLASQGNATINKRADGQVIYEAALRENGEELHNTLTTPSGGQYHLTLADGTDVWLNAASSITYPTAFKGKNRQVEITGEVYFEVAHNQNMPFLVSAKGQTVEVLGTHFNINAYDDEKTINTTLLQGKVKVSANGQVAVINPGEQAQALYGKDARSGLKIIQDVNLDEAVAWKNGFFQFNDADLQTIMRQYARWYDVKVIYEGKILERHFSGEIHRNLNAAQALDLLGQANIHFAISGKTIIVSP